jgi:hypothetical protein
MMRLWLSLLLCSVAARAHAQASPRSPSATHRAAAKHPAPKPHRAHAAPKAVAAPKAEAREAPAPKADAPEAAAPKADAAKPAKGTAAAGHAESAPKLEGGASSPSTTAAASPDPGEIRTEGDTQVKVMEFSGLDIEGQLKTPQMLYFLNRLRAEFGRPRLPHRSFMPELQRSTKESSF